MSAQNCVGCGERLSPGSCRGRRARYHGPACRQRARRARLRTEQGHAWAALERVDAAMVTARRAMANGADAKPAIQQLLSAATNLAELHGIATSASASAAPADVRDPIVTEPVTEHAHTHHQRTTVKAEQDDAAKHVDAAVLLPPPIKPREVVNTDTVRLERLRDRADTRSRMVLAGPEADPRLVGFLQPHGIQQKKWDVFTPGWTRIAGPFRTRQEALVRLLYQHVPFNAPGARKRRPS